ncbi:MAG: TetR/AcrR family transcriptional regulator [Acidimicrobiia bacterium]|nr:TetR/AcrR family transcriptional regulator [Acidimicrobiia bacterium]
MRPPLTRESIVAATRDLIVENGLEELSLRKVAARLDVTAPALYAHFSGKADLLRAVAEEAFEDLIDIFTDVAGADPVETIRARSLAYVDFARSNPRLFRTMFLFQPELSAAPRGNELPLATMAFNMGLESVQEAMKEGALRDGEPLLTALTIWTATHGVATVFLQGPHLGPDAENALATSVIDAVLAGLRP